MYRSATPVTDTGMVGAAEAGRPPPAPRCTDVPSALIDAYPDLLRFFAYCLGPDEAAGAAQDLCECALGRSQSFDPARGPPGPWLWAIAGHVTGARRRCTDRRRAIQDIEAVRDPPGELDAAARCTVDEAVRRLPHGDRCVILLHFWCGWTYPEIARARHKSPAATRKRAQRSLVRLRAALREPTGTPEPAANLAPDVPFGARERY